jgi:hypothetical protein
VHRNNFILTCILHLIKTPVTLTQTWTSVSILDRKYKAKVKVDFALEQAMKAQRESIGIALLFL